LEHLLDASFLGKLLMLPAKVKQDWKVIARYKHSSLFGLLISNEGKKFYNIDTRLGCKVLPGKNSKSFVTEEEKSKKLIINWHLMNMLVPALADPVVAL